MNLKEYTSHDVNGFLRMSKSTAGLVIGWMCVICSLLWCVPLILDLIKLEHMAMLMKKLYIDFDLNDTDLRLVLSVTLVIAVIQIIASISLIAGTAGRHHFSLIPWMVNSGLTIIFDCILFIYFSITAMLDKPRLVDVYLIFMFLVFIIVIRISMFRIICSFYQQLKKDYDMQQEIHHLSYLKIHKIIKIEEI